MKQNREVSYEYHLQKYSEIDPLEATARTGLCFDTEASRFTIDLLGQQVFAEFPEFKLRQGTGPPVASLNKETGEPSPCLRPVASLTGFAMQVLAMRVLYAGVHAPLTGSFKAYRELPWGDVYDQNFSGRCIKRFAYGFGFKPEAFAKAAAPLGGMPLEAGDAAYEFDFMGGIKCRFILWKPDEEFPPSAQILFSDNAVLMYGAEDLAVVGDVLIGALKEMSR